MLTERISRALTSPRLFRVFTIWFLLYCLVGLVFLYTWNDADYWAHAAVIRLFGENFAHPRHPFAGTDAPYYMYTPYHMVWAILSRITGIPAVYIMIPLGMVNATLLIFAVRAVARDIIGDARYVFIVAATLLFFWLKPWTWSGFYQFDLLPLTLTYSFYFALPVALILIASWPSNRHGKWFYVAATPLMAVVILAHPITGSFMLIGIGLRTLFWPGILLRQRALLLAPCAGALLLAFTWPLFSFAGTLFGVLEHVDDPVWREYAGAATYFWHNWPLHIAPAWLGLIYVARRVREKSLDFVSFGVLLFLAIFVLNNYTVGSGAFGRYVAYVALFLQLATVATLREFDGHRMQRYVLGAWVGLLIVGSLWGASRSLTHIGLPYDTAMGASPGTYSNIGEYREWQRFAPYLDGNDVVMAPALESWMLPAMLGVKIVTVLNEVPNVPDFAERREAGQSFFDPATSAAERSRILDRFHADFLMLPASRTDIRAALDARLEYVNATPSYVLYRVRTDGGR